MGVAPRGDAGIFPVRFAEIREGRVCDPLCAPLCARGIAHCDGRGRVAAEGCEFEDDRVYAAVTVTKEGTEPAHD